MIFLGSLALLLASSAVPGPFGDVSHPAFAGSRIPALQAYDRASAPTHRHYALRADAQDGAPLWLAYTVYKTLISAIDGPRCVHYPTCSAFAYLAIRRNGLTGAFMAIDRLLRDSPDANRAVPRRSIISVHGHPRIDDPVEANEIWHHPRAR